MIRRIDIQPKNVFWSENGEMCCITTDESYFVLRYVAENVAAALENKDEMITEDGIEDAFDVLGEIEEVVKTGVWVGDCFIYTNSGKNNNQIAIIQLIQSVFRLFKFIQNKVFLIFSNLWSLGFFSTHLLWLYNKCCLFLVNRLNYYVGGEIVTVSHLDKYVNNNNNYYIKKIQNLIFKFSFVLFDENSSFIFLGVCTFLATSQKIIVCIWLTRI